MRKMSNFILTASFLIAGLLPARLYSQTEQQIEAAKKDGEVTVYGSLETATVEKIFQAFERKYGIRTNYFRGSSPVLIDRTGTEFRAGKVSYDVVFTTTEPMNLMKQAGLFTRYISPSSRHYDKKLMDPFFGPNHRSIIVGILYNTRLVKQSDAPTSYDDVLNPRWKGKLVMGDPSRHDTTINWLASLHLVLGSKEKADDWIRRLAAQNPITDRSMTPASKRIGAGETPIGIVYVKDVFLLGNAGAPVDYVKNLPGYLGDGSYMGLSSNAPHPNAGKLFIDFFLSQESMDIMANAGEFVNREGVYPPIKGAQQVVENYIQMIEMTKDQYEQKKNEYSKIFKR